MLSSILKTISFRIRRNPLRMALILLTVAMGVAILTLTLSISIGLRQVIDRALPDTGHVISVVNGSIDATGSLERHMPPSLRLSDLKSLQSDYPALKDLTPFSWTMPWDGVEANGYQWKPRSVVSAGANYASLMGLEMVEGNSFTQTDVDSKTKSMIVSETVAKTVFGSAEAAIGQKMSTKARMGMRRGSGNDEDVTVKESYTVVGVFKDPLNVRREAYGIGDIVIPLSSSGPMGRSESGVMLSGFMARVESDSVAVAKSKISTLLKTAHNDDDFAVAVWEGDPQEPNTYIADAKDTITKFSLFISIFGFLVLVVSSSGVFSIMIVEAMDRGRELGIRRALGAPEKEIVLLLTGQGGALAAIGSVLGVAIAVIFRLPLVGALGPYLQTSGIASADLGSAGPMVEAAAISLVVSVLACAVFSLFPALQAARKPITACIKEE
jgi:putative ABC transport system permease protein